MRKPRKIKNIDKELTELLDLDGVVVVGGTEDDPVIMSSDTIVPLCERCLQREKLGIPSKYGCLMENHGRFEKPFYDIICKPDGTYKVIQLHYAFYKYICKDEECPTVFQKPIDFARENAHVTKRFEDYAVGLASVMSYSNVSKRLSIMVPAKNNRVEEKQTASKQAVADIIKRWTESRDLERGKVSTPTVLGMMKFVSDGREYVIAFDASDKELRILDVFTVLDQLTMESFLRELDPSVIKGVVTDCEHLIIEACENVLFNIDIMVSIDSLMEQAMADFDTLIREDAIHITNYKKRLLKKDPDDVAKKTYDAQELRDVTKKYTRVSLGYDHVNRLRGLLSRDWDAVDVMNWKENMPDELEPFFHNSSIYVTELWEKMLKYYMRRNEVTGDLYERLKLLNERINKFKFYSGELFKARMLYIPDTYIENDVNDNKWHGVPCETIITALNDMDNEKEDSINEHLWKGLR